MRHLGIGVRILPGTPFTFGPLLLICRLLSPLKGRLHNVRDLPLSLLEVCLVLSKDVLATITLVLSLEAGEDYHGYFFFSKSL